MGTRIRYRNLDVITQAKEAWWSAFEIWIKSHVKLFKRAHKKLISDGQKFYERQLLENNPWLVVWTKLWKKQKAVLNKKEK